MAHTPPRWARTLLRWWADPNTSEELEGDLLELYNHWVATVGERKADWKYTFNAIKLLRPFAQNKRSQYPTTYLYSPTMIRNYFKIAFRNALKYKLFSFINLLGLSLALPSALMALIQIVSYYEYDNFHQDSDRIVRIITDEKQQDGEMTHWASSPVALGKYIKEKWVGVEQSTTLVRDSKWVLSSGIKTKNVRAIYADAAFFQVFHFPLEKGSYPVEANTVVLTHETAEWFFKEVNPIGRILEHPTYGGFKVVGVLKPFNQQKTQFRTDVLVPLAGYSNGSDKAKEWSELNAHTFVKLSKGRSIASFNKQLGATSSEVNKLLDAAAGKGLAFQAQALAEISPSEKELKNDPYVQDVRSIYINFGFQLIILVLAALNYINLTLARSMNRSREVGVRKVAGATKSQIIFQFLTESVLISYLALGMGLFLLWMIKTFIHVSWLTWEIDHWEYLILLFLAFNFVLGIVAGASPSLVLSSYQPVKVLKGTISPASFGKIGFRKSLIIVQFTIALVYIFFIGHAYHQIEYMANDNENYQRENRLNIHLTGTPSERFAAEVSTVKEVEKIGYTSLSFGNTPPYIEIKNTKNDAPKPAFFYAADRQFIDNMGLRIVAGKNLPESKSEMALPMVVVNQKAVEHLHLGADQEAIGKLIVLNDTVSATIVGVVANFCHYDYEHKIEPVVFQYQPAAFRVMCVKTSPATDRASLEATLASLWKKHHPYVEMNASWLDTDMYERYYPYEDMQFAGMQSIVIFVVAILGLIGILTYSLEKRTKEIGIRKVIGATAEEVMRLMAADFIKLLSIAAIIAVPLGVAVGLYMNSYLVFHNGVSYFTMAFLLLLVLGVSLAIVGYFSWRAVQTNPAKTLKSE
ncbi:permease prefix domain 2-containing transporter [Runella sp. MFBS21]|uniref:ABC transporter permease n=1 Tax=Runella sp. MFBS21 TaxID=3034018 RepID=UPI0023F8592A|nr:ABC transporter permease [Runella sp. MFBS21]MDF7815948.1 permease prefix domain 2-containing transporter [Runella sp. MFBS21]